MPRTPNEAGSMAAVRPAQRELEEPNLPSFNWPLPEAVPMKATPIPADLLD
jgi:hypothetical protein